jgi:hypothetical protein
VHVRVGDPGQYPEPTQSCSDSKIAQHAGLLHLKDAAFKSNLPSLHIKKKNYFIILIIFPLSQCSEDHCDLITLKN